MSRSTLYNLPRPQTRAAKKQLKMPRPIPASLRRAQQQKELKENMAKENLAVATRYSPEHGGKTQFYYGANNAEEEGKCHKHSQ